MKRRKKCLFVCIAACSLLLSGCGEPLHELTAEEEDLIVHYAAYMVAKHNIQQKDGASGVVIGEVEEIEDEEEPMDTESTEGVSGTAGNGDSANVPSDALTLAESIGHGSDLDVVYSGSYVADNYVEGSAYAIDAVAGKTFYIMKFTLTNTTESEVAIDNVTKEISFQMTSGELSVKSQVTFLMTDFSTYYGTIPAGQSVETVLLFEVPESEAEAITQPALKIITDGQAKSVKL